MGDSILVAVDHALDNLMEYLSGILKSESVLLSNIVKQLSFLGIFKDMEPNLAGQTTFNIKTLAMAIAFDYVRVLWCCRYINLILKSWFIRIIEYFDCKFLS